MRSEVYRDLCSLFGGPVFPKVSTKSMMIDSDLDEEEENTQEKSAINAEKLKQAPRKTAVLAKTELDQLKQEVQEGIEAEQAGTAQPGWRERLKQKWQEVKEWGKSWISGGSEQVQENE